MEKYGQYRDKGTVLKESLCGVAGMFSVLTFRTTGSGIAPFFPVSNGGGNTPWLFPWRVVCFMLQKTSATQLNLVLTHFQFLFFLRIPFLIFFGFTWFAFIQWTTPGTLLRKANLWCIIGIPGIWWVDLQVDGVRRG